MTQTLNHFSNKMSAYLAAIEVCTTVHSTYTSLKVGKFTMPPPVTSHQFTIHVVSYITIIIMYMSLKSVNRMAAGSRLPRSSHGIFSPSPTFQTHLT